MAAALPPALRRKLEVVVHANVPIFHTEHCVFAQSLSDGNPNPNPDPDPNPNPNPNPDPDLGERGAEEVRRPVTKLGRCRNEGEYLGGGIS